MANDPFGVNKALFTVPPHQQRRNVDERGKPVDPARAGARRAPGPAKKFGIKGSGKGAHKYKSPVGRGKYGNHPSAPHWSHQTTNPRFWANAAVNNPSTTGAGVAAAGAAGLASQRSKMSDKGKRRSDTASAALAGGAGAHVAGQKSIYRRARNYQKPENNMDWSSDGRSKPRADLPSEQKKAIRDTFANARRAGGGTKENRGKVTNQRAFAQHLNANFPEGFKTSKDRRAIATGAAQRKANRVTVATAGLAGAAAYGAHKIKEKRSVSKSAFGVDHG